VAQRLFSLFVLCAILPLSILAYFSFRQVTAHLYQQADQRLHQTSKAAGMIIFERLQFLEIDLKILLSHLHRESAEAVESAMAEFRERLESRFNNLALVNESGHMVSFLGLNQSLPSLSAEEQQHLYSGKTLVVARPNPEGFARIFMIRVLDPTQPAHTVLFGEIHPQYLWGEKELLPPLMELFVVDQSHQILFSSLPDILPWQEFAQAIQSNMTSAQFAWTYAKDTYLAHYWTLFMQPNFFTNWTIVHSQSRADILEPLHYFRQVFPLVILFSFWVVLLLSLVQIRRTLVPIEQLQEATQKIAAQDFSSRVHIKSTDEFAALGHSFNTMAESLETLTQALQESEKRYRDLVEHNPGPICIHDLHGTLLFVNPAWAQSLGYKPFNLFGQRFDQFLAPASQPFFGSYLEHMRQEPNFEGVIHLVTQDGKERVWIYRSLCYEEAGKPPYVFGHAQDITERTQLEAQLHQVQKMEAIGTLASGIAHDFNNILTAMLGYTELSLQNTFPESATWRHLHEVLTAGQRAKDLVQQILIFSRQSGPERKPIEFHLLSKEVLKLLRASLPTTIEIRSHLDPASGMVLANPTQMHQVLMNLCTNAAHAMRERGGILEVTLTPVEVDPAFASNHPTIQPGPAMCLTVRDTGHGMTPEVLRRIFEPFFTTKKVGEGTGMGLSVVHGIITSHGGAITVESTPGQGTTFRVYLPQIDKVPSAEERAEEPLLTGSAHILFVDDEETLALLGQELLTLLGYDVVCCTDSLETLETFRAAPHDFDLVITDQTMPHLTGEALTRELRRLRSDIPIILCTGYTVSEEKQQELGLNAVLLKPFTTRDLGLSIQRVLELQATPH
jgi:PAS domain S-box-containing protein